MRWILRAIGWIGDYQAVTAILQSELLRTYLWPWAFAIMTGGAGIWGHVPAMWILMASAVSFAAVSHGMLRVSEYRERKDPLNKFKYIGTHVGVKVRDVTPGSPRVLEQIQVQIETRNDASFPLSIILEYADTEMEGRTPPRARLLKQPALVGPGANVRHADEPIDMGGMPCRSVQGRMHFILRYGLPHKEIHKLELRGNIQVSMDEFGQVEAVATSWI